MWVCSESSGNERGDREDQNPSSICEILRRIQPNLMGELTLAMMNRRRSPIRRKTMALLVLGPCDSDRRDGNHSSRLLPLTSSLSSVSAATATSRHCSSKANPGSHILQTAHHRRAFITVNPSTATVAPSSFSSQAASPIASSPEVTATTIGFTRRRST